MSQPPAQLVDELKAIRRWSQRASPGKTPEVDTVNVVVGDGVNVLAAGVAAAVRVDFRARITGCFIQEFDGTSGSVSIDIQRAQGGNAPSFASITPATKPGISSGRYFSDLVVTGWTTDINRGDYLRYSIVSATSIKRINIGLRIRRLEP